MEPSLPFSDPAPLPQTQHSAAEAVVVLAHALMTAFDAHLTDLMTQDTPEAVHKARVTLRRFRAALAAFRPVIDEDLAETLATRQRSLFRILGAVRDADVMAARFAGQEQADALAHEAQRERDKARKRLKKKKAAAFSAWVLKRLKGKSWRRTGKKAKALRDAPVMVLAEQALDRAWKAALSNGTDLLAMTPRVQHDLRKDLKMLRYLSEFFVDLWPTAGHEAFLSALRELQDDLGAITDLELARELGHAADDAVVQETGRAAASWADLQTTGPWWHAAETS